MTHAAPPPILGIQDDAVLSSADPTAWALVGALGAGVVRLQIIWPGPSQPFDFTATDRIVTGAASVGAQPLITISAGKPNTLGTGHAPGTPTNAAAFGAFCSQVALRYDGGYVPDDGSGDLLDDPSSAVTAPLPEVDRYSIMNEPNRGQYVWPQGKNGATAPRIAARLVGACMPAIQDANPNVEVALGPLASRGAQGGAPPLTFLEDYRKAGGPQPDAVALNPYLDGLEPNYEPNEHLADGAITLRNLNQLETQVKGDYARPVDVWLTEFAWRIGKSGAIGNVTAARQASLTARTLKLVGHYPFVKLFTWFLLRDQAQGYWTSGLVGPNDQLRPVFKVWARARTTS
jgi:hypothetical protein